MRLAVICEFCSNLNCGIMGMVRNSSFNILINRTHMEPTNQIPEVQRGRSLFPVILLGLIIVIAGGLVFIILQKNENVAPQTGNLL